MCIWRIFETVSTGLYDRRMTNHRRPGVVVRTPFYTHFTEMIRLLVAKQNGILPDDHAPWDEAGDGTVES